MNSSSISYKRHRFPPQIIAHVVWLYVRFNLSLREGEEMLLQRGVDAAYEIVRRWVRKFGPLIARNLRRRQSRPGDVWHLDEVVVRTQFASIGFGAQSISMASCWTKYSSRNGANGLQIGCCAA